MGNFIGGLLMGFLLGFVWGIATVIKSDDHVFVKEVNEIPVVEWNGHSYKLSPIEIKTTVEIVE